MARYANAMLAVIVGLAPGTFHTVLVTQDGSVWSTGVNTDGVSEGFIRVIENNAIAAAAGTGYSIVLKQDGAVWTTRTNIRGQVSFFEGTAISRRTFSLARSIAGAKAVAAGSYHSIILTHEGDVWATGWNKYGQLGDGTQEDRVRFSRVICGSAKAVAAGGHPPCDRIISIIYFLYYHLC